MLRRLVAASPLLVVTLAVTAVGCGDSGSSESATPKAPSGAPDGKRVDTSTAGSVTGRVVFDGTPPTLGTLDISSDARCAGLGRPVQDESVLVSDGGLQNVFVHLRSAPAGYAFEIPTEPARLDQDGCVYTPRVLGVRVGQPIEVSNSDPTAHNVHAAAGTNPQINTAQPFKGMKYTHSFSKLEIMVPFRCDIHPWMLAYAGVVDHPYFAVTGEGGRFSIDGLPPGTYTVEAWHEKFGTRSATFTVGAQETKDLSFTFKAS